MDDPISRQMAIDAILHNQEVYSNNFGDDPIDRYTVAIIANDVQTIVQLPSAHPERQRGRWIEYIPGHGKCPSCGNQVDLLNGKAINFCSECGADMRGEDI